MDFYWNIWFYELQIIWRHVLTISLKKTQTRTKLFSNKFENHIFSILVVNFCHLAVCAFWLWPSSRSSTTSFFCFFARNSLDRHIEWEKTCSFVHMCVCVCDSVSYLYDCVCVCVRMVLCSCVSTFVCIRKRVTVSYISIQF